jgi:chitinase
MILNLCKNKFFRKFGLTIFCIILIVSGLALPFRFQAGAAEGKRIVIYFPNWAIYQSATNLFEVSFIPWNKVTHINHAFLKVGKISNGNYNLALTDEWADTGISFAHSDPAWDGLKGHFGEYKYYKSQYPNVKILISVGGWTKGKYFHEMASTEAGRNSFATSCVQFLIKYPFFDGIDIDWEYPGVDRPANPSDQYDEGTPGGPEGTHNFTLLLQVLRSTLNSNGMSAKLLTIAAPAGASMIALQEPTLYHPSLDFINVMTYDMHGTWENQTNHLSPIYASPNDPTPNLNTDYVMKYFRDALNVPAAKLNIGTPFYSRGWSGVSGGTNGLYATANSGAPGNLGTGGQNTYSKMKELESTSGYVKYWDTYAKVPWLYNASLGYMYTYEDPASLAERCNYVTANGFGGIMAWDISTDDKNGFPLTSVIYNKFYGASTPTPVPTVMNTPTPVRTPAPTVTPVITPTTTRTATPARTVTPMRTATPRITASPRRTATPGRTATPVRTATARVTSTPGQTATPAPSLTPVRTATPLITATPVPSTTPIPPASGIKVQFFNQNTAAVSNQIYPNVQLVNSGIVAITLSNIKIRYYYTVDGTKPQNFYCDYSSLGSANVNGTFVTMTATKSGADTYLELGFSSGAGNLAAGASAVIQARFAKNDWSNYTQSNDYSFNGSATGYVDWSKVTAYVNGTLQWGVEP